MTESRAHRKSLISEKGRHSPKLFSCMSALLLHCIVLLFLPRLENQRVWSSLITMVSILLSTFLPEIKYHETRIVIFLIEFQSVDENMSWNWKKRPKIYRRDAHLLSVNCNIHVRIPWTLLKSEDALGRWAVSKSTFIIWICNKYRQSYADLYIDIYSLYMGFRAEWLDGRLFPVQNAWKTAWRLQIKAHKRLSDCEEQVSLI